MQVHELITALLKVDGALEVEVEAIGQDDLVLIVHKAKYDGSNGRRRVVIETTEK